MDEVEFAKTIESAAGSLSSLEALDGMLNAANFPDDAKARLRARLRSLIALAKEEKMRQEIEDKESQRASIFRRPRG